jgi:hypothetical protein
MLSEGLVHGGLTPSLGQIIMVGTACGGKCPYFVADREQTGRKRLETRYNLQRCAPVTYFLQLGSTS